jgi:hypothetical protein
MHATTTKIKISAIIVGRYFVSEQPEFKKSGMSLEQMLVIGKLVTISLYTF